MALIFAYSLIIYVFSACIYTVSCENKACKESGPCFCVFENNTRVDLHEIAASNHKALFSDVPYIINATIQEVVLFSYNPCNPFTEINSDAITTEGEKPCVDVAACKLTPGTEDGKPSQMNAIGVQSTAKFIEEGGLLKILYMTPKSESNLTVTLVCNKTIEHKLTVDFVGEYYHNMTLTTKCACPDGCKSVSPPDNPDHHGLSTGSVLLITFFTILGVYLILGMAYNFCNGAKGAELLPNLGFWNDLPQLIIDGFLFTCSCCTRRQQASYSDM